MFFKLWKSIAGGKTLTRALMNNALRNYSLAEGKVLDIGGGKKPSYFEFLQNVEKATVINFDKQHSDIDIDFEKDALLQETESVDQVLMFNILEHIYNHNWLVGEVHRVLKKDKQVIGFVPFLIQYHPDPNDYFRYTSEALELIFDGAGFKEVEIITLGYGPSSANFNNFASFMPRIFNVIVWPFYYLLDSILLFLKPNLKKRFPIGYLFILKK